MGNINYTKTFLVKQTPQEVFSILKNVQGWWSGLYGEEINGHTEKLDDEFTFHAGGGAHYSKQKLIELVPDKKLVWLVTESNLSFLEDTNEWTGTKLHFDITKEDQITKVTFSHLGLVPKIECYNSCSSAWTNYLEKLHQQLV